MSKINEQIERLRELVRKCYSAVAWKNGTIPNVGERTVSNLGAAIESIPEPLYGKFVFIEGTGINTLSEFICACRGFDRLLYVEDDSTVTLIGPYAFSGFSAEYYIFSKLEVITDGVQVFYGNSRLKKIIMPSLTKWTGQQGIRNCTVLEELYIPKLASDPLSFLNFVSNPNLIDITLGENMRINFSLRNWNPTNALQADSSSLVYEGEPFANNLEKLLYNIREHIAANLNPNITATITFSAEVKAAILASEETMEAFPKSWTIA